MTINIEPEDRAVFARLKSTGAINHRLRRTMTEQFGKCVICATQVVRGRPLFAGYNAEGSPLVVGACCADALSSLATPIYRSMKLNVSAWPEEHIWRYMDFAKFVSMVQQRSLYFPRADQLEDRFEGATGLARREAEWDAYYLDEYRELLKHPPVDAKIPSNEEIEINARRLLGETKAAALSARNLLVSCWHNNEKESEALWRLYCPTGTAGVAIQSTVAQLWDACTNRDDVVVGRVRYVDFARRFASIQNDRIFQKRITLQHEHEIRAVLENFENVEGHSHACNLEALISRVVISPFAPPWFESVLRKTLDAFGTTLEVQASTIRDEPFY